MYVLGGIKITEKRFKISDYPSDIEDTVTGKKYAMSSYYTHMKIMCDLLNELSEENMLLKEEVGYYKLLLMSLEEEAKKIGKIR